MHPSLLAVPALMGAFACLKKSVGPRRTVQACARIADFLRPLHLLAPCEPTARELRLVQRCTFPPHVACLELACAWLVWLAVHGRHGAIRIGKCTDGGQIRMHAWVVTADGEYFADARFTPCFGDFS